MCRFVEEYKNIRVCKIMKKQKKYIGIRGTGVRGNIPYGKTAYGITGTGKHPYGVTQYGEKSIMMLIAG